jgi:uncharacterized protein YndB with AHSA1/START domain
MTTQNDPVTQSAPGDLLLTRVFDAPRALVFAAWTDPGQLAQWWGPHGFTNPRCEWDVSPGGLIRVDMRGPDGTVYPMVGAYREIVEPERLVFTAGALDAQGELLFEIMNTVTFAEAGGKTTVTLRTEVLNQTTGAAQHLDGQAEGWSQSLERFGTFLEEVQKEGAAAAAGRELVISRDFDASREMLWEAMTTPVHFVQWWGPQGFSTTVEEMDVRPGGALKFVMHGPDGTDYPNDCVFTEVVKPERVGYSLGGGRKGAPAIHIDTSWTFDALEGGRTRVTIHMEFRTPEDREKVVKEYGAIEGGKQTLGRLAELAAKTPLVIERAFDAPVETVWRAITDNDHIQKWFFELPEFKPEPGFEFQFVVEHDGTTFDHRCRVTEVIPGKKLSYTWRYEGYEGDSLVTFELFPEEGKTRLRLTHEGLHTFPKTPAYARTNFLRGWTSLIGTDLKEAVCPAASPAR